MNSPYKIICILILVCGLPSMTYSQLVTDNSVVGEDLVRKIIGDGIEIINFEVKCPDVGIGTFTSNGLPTNDGVLLTTGTTANAIGPDDVDDRSTNHGGVGDQQLDNLAGFTTYDACVLEFDFVSYCNTFDISYFFASEEYDEYVGREYNDVFGIFISGTDPNNTAPYDNLNLAVLANGDNVTVNNINNTTNNHLYNDNNGGNEIQYDGYTTLLSNQIAITPCDTYKVRIAIADVTDGIFDAGLFIAAKTLGCDQTISAVSSSLTNGIEGCSDASIRFCRDGDLTLPRTFQVTTQGTGTATFNTDYTFNTTITIAANQACVDVPISITNDSDVEGEETFQIIYQKGSCLFYDTTNFTIRDNFSIDLGPDIALCEDKQITIGINTENGYTYSWNNATNLSNAAIGDPIYSANTTNQQTTETYTLTVTSPGGCTASDQIDLTPNYNPVAEFSSTDGCDGSIINFHNQTAWNSPNGVNQWFFGEGSVSSTIDPVFTFTNEGTYNVLLVTTNDYGCIDSVTHILTVFPMPVPDFTVTNNCLNSNTCLTNTSTLTTGNISSWVWDFGDNSALNSDENPCHTYTNQGTYKIRLIAQSDNNCTEYVEKSIVVHAQPLIDYATSNACKGTPTQFINNSYITTGQITNWYWDFGNGNSSTDMIPSETYNTANTYTVKLVGESNYGCIDSIVKDITINENPTADFGPNSLEICQGECVNFIDQSTTPTGTIDSWRWLFPHSQFSEQDSPEMCYDSIGFFPTTLIIENDSGCSDTLTKTLHVLVHPRPEVDFTLSSTNTSLFSPGVTVSEISNTNTDNWEISFGDTRLEQFDLPPDEIEHSYDTSGIYPITLFVSNVNGCSDSLTKTFTITPIQTLYIPNAFTPGDDVTNNFFIPVGIDLENIEMQIFDRWGELLFQSYPLLPWDGTYNGLPVKSDVYICKIINHQGDKPITYIHRITLIR